MLQIETLHISFHKKLKISEAVRDISFSMGVGEILGLVGESGSGKTMTALAIAGLLRRRDITTSGRILFDGVDLLTVSRDVLRTYQGNKIGIIFQEPMTSLNPLMRVGRQVEESLRIHHGALSAAERRQRALKAMAAAELPEPAALFAKYPHELSGGMRQRVMIAAAIITRPALLIADEPTTALDVTIQAQILKLLQKLNREMGVGILFISHDLSVVRRLCHRVIVMEKGRIAEEGGVDEIFNAPRAEYTKRLIASIPQRRRI